jgi:MinD-like ATPase involved in chromosome partitioning or flagellar assembly
VAEPELAVVYSSREWADRVVRHVTNHGGGRVRLRVVDARVAMEEEFDVLIAEDITSFLNPRFVQEVRRRGRRVLGVYDPEEPTGKERLLDLGVDDVIESTAPAESFVRVLAGILPVEHPGSVDIDLQGLDAAGPVPGRSAAGGPRARGLLCVVGGPPGGCGASEVSVELAHALRRRGEVPVLLDAEDVAPALAQRLALPPIPNIRTAIDAVFHGAGLLSEALMPVTGGGFDLLAGLANPADWAQVRPQEIAEVAAELSGTGAQVVANVGSALEDLPAAGGPDRYGMSRVLVACADALVGVGVATPVGVARLVAWIAEVVVLAPGTPLHLAINKAPASRFIRSEVEAELQRNFLPASLHFVPVDDGVDQAAWRGELVAPGPFTRAVEALAASVLHQAGRQAAPAPRRRRRMLGRAS